MTRDVIHQRGEPEHVSLGRLLLEAAAFILAMLAVIYGIPVLYFLVNP